ncbi:MAG: hypothetical protein V4676_08795 [Bacteroidota bacterium]
MKTVNILLAFTLTIIIQTTMAQTDSAGTKSKPQFKISANYNSHLNYYGRTDSLKSTGFFPVAEFWITPKFYVTAAPVFVNNALQSFAYAGTIATAGFLQSSEKWITNLYVTKPIYQEEARLIQSALKAQSGISVSRLSKTINLTLGGDVKLSDQIDYGATAGLDHLVRIENKKGEIFIINPSIYLFAGTQNFSNTYNKKQQGLLPFQNNTQQVTEEGQRFVMLASEVSVPLIFAKGKWMILVTPSYILPQNLVSIPGRPEASEQGRNLFYATTGIKYSF